MIYVLKQVGGSFLRTAGRFLFYILIGGLIALLLGSCEVNAATEGVGWMDKNVKNYITSSRLVNWTGESTYSFIDTTITPLGNAYASIPATSNNLNVAGNGVSYQIYLEQNLKVGYLYSIELYTCNYTESAKFHTLLFEVSSGSNPNVSLSNTAVYSYASASDISTYYTVPEEGSTLEPFTSCYVFTGLISPSVEGAWFDIRFRNMSNISFYPYLMGFSMEELGIYDEALESTINNIVQNSGLATASSLSEVQSSVNTIQEEVDGMQEKQDETNKNLDEINENITSDEVDTSSASGFFDNFTTEDNGGLSSVVTAPLRFVQKLTDSCEPLEIPLFGETISFPCGDEIFWNREDVQTFRTTWNILFGGGIIYMLMTKLFKVIENLKNPENSKVEVMKL